MSQPGSVLERIQQVMLDTFDRDGLRLLVRTCLDKNFDELTPDKTMAAQVFALLTWAQRNGRVFELVKCACRQNPRREDLETLCDELANLPQANFAPLPTDLRWRVPFLRNEQFAGREDDLAGLHLALQEGAAVGIRPAGLTGLGGIGKTQLVVEYCYRYRDAYPGGVYWINAAGEWLPAFAELGLYLDEELYGKALDRQARAAVEYFSVHPHSLLVLDNVSEPTQLRAPVTPDLIPARLPCRVIFTTRRRDLGDFHPLELSVLPEAPGLHLLLRHPTRKPALDLAHPEHAAAVEIYAILGGLPLALEIAGAHLAKFAGKPIAAYRDELLKRGALAVVDDRRSGVKDTDLGTRHTAAVEATLAEQWDSLPSDDARLLLRVAGQFSEAAVIPASRLGLLADISDQDEGFFGSPLELALAELHDYALIERLSDNEVTLHPLVREFAHLRTTVDSRLKFRQWCGSNILMGYRSFGTIQSQCRHRGVEAVEADLVAALALTQYDQDLQSQIDSLLRMLRRESHALQNWDPIADPKLFSHQWLKRVMIEGDTNLKQEVAQMEKMAHLAIPWLAVCTSNSLHRTLVGHADDVLALVITPDGKRVISGSTDGTLKIWNLATGVEERTMTGHGGAVYAVAVTPDGKKAISASDDGTLDGTLRVWDLTTGMRLCTLRAHHNENPRALEVAAQPPDWLPKVIDSNWLNSFAASRGIRSVKALATTPDGRCAISVAKDRRVSVWNISICAEEKNLELSSSGLTSLSGLDIRGMGQLVVTPDGQRVFGESGSGLKVWDLTTGSVERTIVGHYSWSSCVAAMPDSHRIIASVDGEIKVWNLSTGAEELTIRAHDKAVNAMAVTPDSRYVITASNDRTLKVWDLRKGAEERILASEASVVHALAVTPDGHRVISASADGTLKVWNLASQPEFRLSNCHGSAVLAVATVPNDQRAVTASRDNTLKVWNLVTGAEENTLKGHKDWVNSVVATSDGRYTISASADGMLRMWDVATGKKKLKQQVSHNSQVPFVQFSPDGRAILLTDDSATSHTSWIRAVTITPNGQRVISASVDGTLRMWRLKTSIWDVIRGAVEEVLFGNFRSALVRVFTGHSSMANALVPTPDENRLISASADGEVKVWNLSTGTEELALKGHSDCVNAIAVTPDSQRVITASNDRTLKIWNLVTGAEERTLRRNGAAMRAVAVMPDGQRVISGSDDFELNVWSLPTGQKLATIVLEAGVMCVAVAPDGVIIAGDAAGNVYCLRYVEPDDT